MITFQAGRVPNHKRRGNSCRLPLRLGGSGLQKSHSSSDAETSTHNPTDRFGRRTTEPGRPAPQRARRQPRGRVWQDTVGGGVVAHEFGASNFDRTNATHNI